MRGNEITLVTVIIDIFKHEINGEVDVLWKGTLLPAIKSNCPNRAKVREFFRPNELGSM